MQRAWSVDEIYEQIEQLDGDIVHYGDAVDETPLIAVRWKVDGAPRILLWGAPSGAELNTSPLAIDTAQWWRDAGWEVWLVPILDPAGGRQNEAALDLSSPPTETAGLIRRAWAPGESIEEWLPINRDRFWQPTKAHPEASVTTRPESTGLWTLLDHCQPDVTVSLHEHLVGGAGIGVSQGINREDVQTLLDAVEPLYPLHQGAKLLLGKQLAQHPNVIALPTLDEEAERIVHSEEQTILVGGASFWQVASGISWQLWLPRWQYQMGDSGEIFDDVWDVVYAGEQRDRNGKLVPVQITTLDRPGHPAHGQELRTVDLKRTETAAIGSMPRQPVLSGWLAIEAWHERQTVLKQALDAIELVRAHDDKPTYERAAQIIRWGIHYEDHLMRSYLQNKRYGKRATVAERDHWSITYRLEAVAMIGEAMMLVAGGDQRDTVIETTVNTLNDLITEHMPTAPMQLLPLDQRRQWIEQWSAWFLETRESGGFERARLFDRLERTQKQLGVAKRAARDAKNLKRPRAEQLESAQRVDELQALLKELENSIEQDQPITSEIIISSSDAENTVDTPVSASAVESERHQSSHSDNEALLVPEDKPHIFEPKTTDDMKSPQDVVDPVPALAPGRTLLTDVLREALVGAGLAPALVARYETRGVPITMLDDLDIDISVLTPESSTDNHSDSEPLREDIPSPSTEWESLDEAIVLEPVEESHDIYPSAVVDTELIEEDVVEENEISTEFSEPVEKESQQEPTQEQEAETREEVVEVPEEPAEAPEEVAEALPDRVPMTDAIRDRLKEEGLPPVIIERLSAEGIPRTLVEHLNIDLGDATDDEQSISPVNAQPVKVEDAPLEEGEVDLDVLLPPQLILDPEWGRGPIRWEEQLPETHERPFAALVDQLMSGDHESQPEAVSQLQDEDALEVIEPTIAVTVVELQETGFLRQRVELRTIVKRPIPHLPYPAPTGGFFVRKERILRS